MACFLKIFRVALQTLRLCKGPMYQSQVEFTITTVVSWDLTSVEGVSGGLTMNYSDAFGQTENVVAIPPKFEGATVGSDVTDVAYGNSRSVAAIDGYREPPAWYSVSIHAHCDR